MVDGRRRRLVLVAAVVAAAAAAALVFVPMDTRRGGGGGARTGATMLEISDVEIVPVDGGAAGPESVAFDDAGEGPYTGVSDGRVLRWLRGERRWVEHSSALPPQLLGGCRGSHDPEREHQCGRPLGLKFHDKTGELYVADAYLGLRVVAPGENVSRPLLPPGSPAAGSAFSFANGVEIDHTTGAVYFTQTSTRFQRRDFLKIVISGDNTGRLLKFDPASEKVEVLLDGLAFPNGLAMSDDGSHLLLAETTTGKILRYWLRAPEGGASGLVEEVARLPGFPDNIKRSPRGGLWVALHGKRGKLADWAVSYPWLRRLVSKVPPRRVQRASELLGWFGRQVIALRVSEEGEVVEEVTVHGAARRTLKSISEVEERDGCLWIGSVHSPFLGLYRL